MPASPLIFDRALVRRRLERAARADGAAEVLHRRVAEDLVWRLEAILRDFPLAVDLGGRRGAFARALAGSAASGRIGLIIQTNFEAGLLGEGPGVVADEERLPFAAGSLDLIVSPLALHTVNDLPGALVQARRALKPDGLFMAAIVGGATLNALRIALLTAEAEITGGAAQRIAPLIDPRDAAGLLQRAGFGLPTADVDRVTLRYDSALHLMHELRTLGETAALLGRRRPLTRAVVAEACRLYARDHAGPDGRVAAEVEIVTLTGWAPSERR